jgi:hypothetical protein
VSALARMACLHGRRNAWLRITYVMTAACAVGASCGARSAPLATVAGNDGSVEADSGIGGTNGDGAGTGGIPSGGYGPTDASGGASTTPGNCADVGHYPGTATCCKAQYCAGFCIGAESCRCGATEGGCIWPEVCCNGSCIGVSTCNGMGT